MPPTQLLIIDTDGSKEYYYRNTKLLAESVGFKVDFLNLYDLLENKQISDYPNVLIFLSPYLFRTLNHEISQKLIKLFEDFSNEQNKFIGILLPSIMRYNESLFEACAALLEKLGLFKDKFGAVEAHATLRPLVYAFIKFILQPDEKIGSLFGTTLVNKKSALPESFKDKGSRAIIDKLTGNTIFKVLPGNHEFTYDVIQSLPAGLFVKNQSSNNSFFISKTSAFNFADITENYFKTPIHVEKRNELLMVVQQTLWEIYIALKYNNMPLITTALRPPLPPQLTPTFMRQEKLQAHQTLCRVLEKNKAYSWICNEGIIAGWLEPSDYFLEADSDELAKIAAKSVTQMELLKKQALDRGINFIYQAELNLLWFEFNPESFMGENALWKEKRANFKRNVQTILHALKEKFEKANKPMPKVFIGTDITTNYRKAPVPCAAKDVYGHEYTKIPCPLDFKEFWTKELLDTLDVFYDVFHQEIPIDGIFLDFEMYHAQDQASLYTDIMDFSDLSWKLYCSKTGDPHTDLTTVAQRVHYLSKQQKFDEYFTFLEQEARLIGKKIKDHLHLIYPDMLIGAYAPTLPSSWFYRGMFSGLSSKDKPLILATFNVDYYSHYKWLINNDIFVLHGTPILLSKFQTQKDLDLIPDLLQFHDFIWYNRPSRQIYKNIKNRSWGVEASPIDADALSQGIKKIYQKIKKVHSK